METAATASFVPNFMARTGVSRLPIAKPLIEAMAPARTATAHTTTSKLTSADYAPDGSE